MDKLQELTLIARCVASDDRRAFGLLVEAYADDIRRLLLGLTKGDVALVDDLAQETFLKAYLAIHSFEGIARFRTWLYRIAYNEYLSYVRRLRPLESLDEAIAPDKEPEYEPYNDGPIGEETLHQALVRLPERERVVTQLFYFDNFSISRISTITGMPQGTVKCYLSRARGRLALLLDKYRY